MAIVIVKKCNKCKMKDQIYNSVLNNADTYKIDEVNANKEAKTRNLNEIVKKGRLRTLLLKSFYIEYNFTILTESIAKPKLINLLVTI